LLDLPSFTNVCKTFVDLYKIGLKVFDSQGTKLVDMKVARRLFAPTCSRPQRPPSLHRHGDAHQGAAAGEHAAGAGDLIAMRNCFSACAI